MREYVIQLIEQNTGRRSPSLRGELQKIVQLLRDQPPEGSENLAVIIIAWIEGDELEIVNDHIFSVQNFVQVYKDRTTHFTEMDVDYEEYPDGNS